MVQRDEVLRGQVFLFENGFDGYRVARTVGSVTLGIMITLRVPLNREARKFGSGGY